AAVADPGLRRADPTPEGRFVRGAIESRPHVLRRPGREDRPLFAVEPAADRNGEADEIGGRRPEPCGRHLREDLPVLWKRSPIVEVASRSAAVQVLGQWLFEGARLHPEGIENEFAGEIRKGPP